MKYLGAVITDSKNIRIINILKYFIIFIVFHPARYSDCILSKKKTKDFTKNDTLRFIRVLDLVSHLVVPSEVVV